MALIACPNCGNKISDKAVKCVHCGYNFNEENVPEEKEVKHCTECGAVITDDMDICPSCGCPIEKENAEDVQKVEVTNVKIEMGKKQKKTIIALAAVAIVIIVCIFMYSSFTKQNTHTAYMDNYERCLNLMIKGAGEAEEAGGLIHDVWYNTIYEKKDYRTDPFTMTNYSFNEDFNYSLILLYADEEFQSSIESIKSNQKSVESLRKELMNPPEDCKEAYEALKTFYDAYSSLVNLVLNPTGNLQSYTSSFNEADSETAKAYKAATLYLED